MEHLHPSVKRFRLHSEFEPSGDQPGAIDALSTVGMVKSDASSSVLQGAARPSAMANMIERLNIPTLILSHNKTLARQLYHEVAGYFPENAVEYFVSHYDYYQPEAYLAKRDLYIDKEMSINERIEQNASLLLQVSSADPIASSSRPFHASMVSIHQKRSLNTMHVSTKGKKSTHRTLFVNW